MVKKTYVLDTNVLLNDPKSLYSFPGNDIILPFTVLEELDSKKTKLDEVGANARTISRVLHNIIKSNPKRSLKKGIIISEKTKLKIVSSKDFIEENAEEEFVDNNKADNRILAVASGLTKKLKTKVVLVTSDVLLRIKAEASGILTEEYNKNYSNSISVETVDKNEIYSGFRTITVSSEELSWFWENKKDREYLAYATEKLIGVCSPNEFIIVKDGNGGEPFVIRYMMHEAKFVQDYYEIQKIKPRNTEQRLSIDLLMDKNVNLVTCVGFAGTGKTLISLAAGLEQVVNKKTYDTLIVCRPVQPLGKDIGYLPGSIEEKLDPWIAPIKDNLKFLLSSGRKNRNNDNALNYYFDRGIISIEAMAYIRGRSIANAYMIIDEAQNLSIHELKTIITRAGEGTKIVLTGDVEQIDNLQVDSISNGLSVAVNKFKDYEIAGHVTLTHGERSELASLAAKIL